MSEQGGTLAKLSKSQKKKKAAQKKKLARTVDKTNEEREAAERVERVHDEIDARTVEEFNDRAMKTRDFQIFNIRGKLLAHPSQSFLDAFTNLRLSMGRETYPNRISHAQRLYSLGAANNVPLPSWSVAMGAASYIPINRFLLDPNEDSLSPNSPRGSDGEGRVAMFRFAEPMQGRKGAFTDRTHSALGLMVWYPIISMCMAAGDKLACIALRDTCVLLKTCYGLFRNDTTRLEQFVFDPRKPDSVKQLDWVARRLEVPLSPPQTPPRGFAEDVTPQANSLLVKDPFRSPIVVTKRWSDYDEDDESLGSPMSLPITPESSSDVPVLDLSGSSEATSSRTKEPQRRIPTIVIAIPTLTDSAPWFNACKTVSPIPRISIFTSEDYPRASRTESLHVMKLQSSTSKQMPGSTGHLRERARLENWIREDVEQKLKARFSLSGTAKKKADVDAGTVIYNRMAALTGLNTGEITYIGEPDILGANAGICVDDMRHIMTARFKEQDSKGGSVAGTWSKVMLVPSTEGWSCKCLGSQS